jgi:SRSO17 transposase
LVTWLEPFEDCFGHVAQRGAFRRYLLGLLSDSPRKSMSAMLARIHDPGSYQAFQHFITHAPWDVAPVWRRLLARVPDRQGVLILDDTGFPKQGTKSVGVQRQYSGTLGKIGNCQVAVTAALWTGVRAWLLGAELYLPESWLTRARRQQAHIPARVRFPEKWRLALTLIDRVRRAGIDIELVAADAGYGDTLEFRAGLEARGLRYMVGVSGQLAVWIGQPPTPLAPSTRAVTAASIGATSIATWAAGPLPGHSGDARRAVAATSSVARAVVAGGTSSGRGPLVQVLREQSSAHDPAPHARARRSSTLGD